jgi:plasmid stabilization system protein ParE
MAKEIIWTKRANQKFNKIISYLEEEWNESVTQNFVQTTYKILELLSKQPYLGSLENSKHNIRGILVSKQNRLFYRISDDKIILVNFFDTRSKKRSKKY